MQKPRSQFRVRGKHPGLLGERVQIHPVHRIVPQRVQPIRQHRLVVIMVMVSGEDVQTVGGGVEYGRVPVQPQRTPPAGLDRRPFALVETELPRRAEKAVLRRESPDED